MSTCHKNPTTLLLILILTQIILATAPAQAQPPKQLSITVICFEFPDISRSESISTIRSTAIDQVNEFYQQVSYGQFSVTGQIYGWYMMSAPLSKWDITGWNSPSDDRWGVVQVALSVAESNGVKRGAYTFLVFAYYSSGSPQWGFAYADLKLSVQSSNSAWQIYAHELGHLTGLPDLYDLAQLRKGRSDTFVGPWDLMSSGSTMCVWSKIRLGWIQKSQITKLELGSSVTISPLELGKGILAARIEYSYSVTRYYLVEVRLGCGVLITEIDETKANGEGTVKVIDAHPESLYDLSDACFDLISEIPDSLFRGKHISAYINPYRTMAIILLSKNGENYKITLGTDDMGKKALDAYKNVETAKSSIKKAESEIRVEGLDQAKATLDKAISQYQEMKFTDCSLLAQNAKIRADFATIPKSYYQAKEMIETTDNRLKTLLARKLESSDATAKRDEAVAAMNKSRDAFKSLQFESTLADLKYCDWLISEAERVEQDFQIRKWAMITAIALAVIGLTLLLAKRRAKNHQ